MLAPNAKQVADEAVGRALFRLSSEYGAPYGADQTLLQQKAHEWSEALIGLSPTRIEAAVSEWILSQDKWPRVANIRQMVLDATPKVGGDHRRHRADNEPKDQATLDRATELTRIRKKHELSETPFADTLADPEYQALLADFTRRTGRRFP